MNLIVTVSLFLIGAVSITSATEDKHWPDFSCLPHKNSTRQENAFKHHRMGWSGCEDSFKRTKQECDKMCVLFNRNIVRRSKKEDPFTFEVDAFMTIMLKELGYFWDKKEAPEDLVKKVKSELQICKTKHREYETMKNFRNLPCEPYNDLFQCIDKAVGCLKN